VRNFLKSLRSCSLQNQSLTGLCSMVMTSRMAKSSIISIRVQFVGPGPGGRLEQIWIGEGFSRQLQNGWPAQTAVEGCGRLKIKRKNGKWKPPAKTQNGLLPYLCATPA